MSTMGNLLQISQPGMDLPAMALVVFMKIKPVIFGSGQVATMVNHFETLQVKTGFLTTMLMLLLKIKQARFGLLQEATPLCMMEKRLQFSAMGANLSPMFVQLLKILKAIFGWVVMMGSGAMMAIHLPISRRSLLVISSRIKKAISGPVQKALIARPGLVQKRVISKLGHFRDMTEILCLIKSQQ